MDPFLINICTARVEYLGKSLTENNKVTCNLLIVSQKRESAVWNSGGSRQNFDRVLSQKNIAKNDVLAHSHSNLAILTGFQKPCNPVWIRHCEIIRGLLLWRKCPKSDWTYYKRLSVDVWWGSLKILGILVNKEQVSFTCTLFNVKCVLNVYEEMCVTLKYSILPTEKV